MRHFLTSKTPAYCGGACMEVQGSFLYYIVPASLGYRLPYLNKQEQHKILMRDYSYKQV